MLDLDGNAGRGEEEAIAAGELLRDEGPCVGGPAAQQAQQAAVLCLVPEELVQDAERRAGAGARVSGAQASADALQVATDVVGQACPGVKPAPAKRARVLCLRLWLIHCCQRGEEYELQMVNGECKHHK